MPLFLCIEPLDVATEVGLPQEAGVELITPIMMFNIVVVAQVYHFI